MSTRILLVGAGAIGAFYGSRLATLRDIAVSALCRSNYAVVNEPEFVFRSPEEAREISRSRRLEWRFLLVATKALPEVSDDSTLLEGLVGSETAIVLVQNGLGVEQPYRDRFPDATILSAVTIASCNQPEHGTVRHHRWTRFSLGPYLPHLDSGGAEREGDRVAGERNRGLVELLRRSGIEDVMEYDHAGLQFVRWHKVAINASMNPTCVLAGGCSNQAMAIDEALAEHTLGVMKEVLAAAPKILGRPLPDDLATPEQILLSARKNDSGSKPSMWADWESGKRMELEVILGNAIRLAREKGIELPRLESMYALLSMAQKMRDETKKREGKL